MTPTELLTMAVGFAFGFFAVGVLLMFSWGLLLGFVDFMRRLLG